VLSGSAFIGRVTTGLTSDGDFLMQFERDESAETRWVDLNKLLMYVVFQFSCKILLFYPTC